MIFFSLAHGEVCDQRLKSHWSSDLRYGVLLLHTLLSFYRIEFFPRFACMFRVSGWAGLALPLSSFLPEEVAFALELKQIMVPHRAVSFDLFYLKFQIV